MQKINLEMQKLYKALTALEDIYLKPVQKDRSNIDATIQRFEFTIELFWKALRIFLHNRGVEVHYPKDTLRESYKSGILEDEEIWLKMLKDRGLTSHTYDEHLADAIFKRIRDYVPALKEGYMRLSQKITQHYN